MSYNGSLFRAFIVAIAAAFLSIGALFAAIVPATAADFALVFKAEPSLALDALGHKVMLNAAPPNGSAASAFIVSAMQHDLYVGNGFVHIAGIAGT
ncbi:hypothetical protein PRN20_18180 [Devosia sp. ZB163]|uniref:hypothetical protein n=1 Tax=Devosia sp. ZB163 TaxID=3025938 RepID=UPI0023609270|nr:hypothetical protein [Devosia sp. ZB163]MDC9825666.1 hypothetical protein [Devosia sp. ZB163]